MPGSLHSAAKKPQTENTNIFKEGNISLILDSYDDIFSDFDPRPFSERALSIDFLDESKRASRDKMGSIALNLLMPSATRNEKKESVIKGRLRGHFRKHFNEVRKEYLSIMKKGAAFVAFGIILMFIATFILFEFKQETLFTTFLVILLEPGGWFLFWEGLSLIIFEVKKKRPELDFYRKMANAQISFSGY